SAGDKKPKVTTTTEPPVVPAPLTGRPIDREVARRPVVSVKVDNSPQGRPQAGLAAADVVFEEKVEGGVTRFIAIFQSQDTDLVGPIRSLRTTDPPVVSALGGVFVFSGGAAIAQRRLDGAPVKAVSEDKSKDPFTYPKGKRRPFATFAATARLRQEAPSDARTPPALFAFLAEGEAFAAAGAAPAVKAQVNYSPRTSAGFDFDAASGTWLRSTNGTPHVLADQSRLAFTNVIIQYVNYTGVGYNDSSGNPVDEAAVVGSGEAVVLVGGQQVRGRWSKPGPTDVTAFTDASGAPLKLAPGTTLVALAPTGAPTTIS
ncbi:MAG TPA: DUF3048 domain-containing protein, partial [Acidimicrobiales bacterium]|nr:DUF3048 domain-containing protein [Acidimicrobiales bacterium]